MFPLLCEFVAILQDMRVESFYRGNEVQFMRDILKFSINLTAASASVDYYSTPTEVK